MPESDLHLLPAGASAIDLLNQLQDILHKHHAGRVENAFLLGMLAQIFLSNPDVEKIGKKLKQFSEYGTRIWTEETVLLPPSHDLQTAAKTLFEFANRGQLPSKPILDTTLSALERYYTAPSRERGIARN